MKRLLLASVRRLSRSSALVGACLWCWAVALVGAQGLFAWGFVRRVIDGDTAVLAFLVFILCWNWHFGGARYFQMIRSGILAYRNSN
jgi:hypothetical protein